MSDLLTGLSLETSAECQLHCPLCFRRSYAERPRPRLMPLEVAAAVSPYLSGLSSIDLTGWGEPLLNPQLFAIIERIRRSFSGRLTMTSNGLLLDSAAMEKIIACEMDTVCISVDAASGGTYQAVRPGGDFSRLTKILAEFAALRARRRSAKPLLFATFLLRRSALTEIPPFVRLVSELGLDGAVFQQMTGVFSEAGLSEVTHSGYYGNRFEEGELAEAMAAARAAARPGLVLVGPENIGGERVGNCGGFDISRAFITAAGLVSVCCAMAYPCALLRRDGRLKRTLSVTFGDVLTTPLPRLWGNPEYAAARAEIRGGGIPRACGDCIALYMRGGEVWRKEGA